MSNATSSSAVVRIRDGASLIFNLPEYDVIDAVDLPTGGRRVVVQAVDRDDACPDCGVISTRVHQWTRQRVADLPAGGAQVEVVVRKPRMLCAEPWPAIDGRSSKSPTSCRCGHGA